MNLNTLMKDESGDSSPASTTDGGDSHENAGAGEETGMVSGERKPVNSTALTIFIIMVLGAGGTYFMHLRTGPKSAAAAGTDPAAAAAVDGFLTDGRRTLNQMWVLLQGTQKLVEQFKIYPSVAQIPLTDLKANPFHLSTAQAAVVEDTAEVARKKKEAEKLAVLQGAQSLQVQSLMRSGSKRMAMINNTMYQEGDAVDGFVIEKIGASTIIVKQAGYRFEVTLAK